MSVVGDINDFLRHSGSLKEAVQLLREAKAEIENLTQQVMGRVVESGGFTFVEVCKSEWYVKHNGETMNHEPFSTLRQAERWLYGDSTEDAHKVCAAPELHRGL